MVFFVECGKWHRVRWGCSCRQHEVPGLASENYLFVEFFGLCVMYLGGENKGVDKLMCVVMKVNADADVTGCESDAADSRSEVDGDDGREVKELEDEEMLQRR